MRDYTHQIETLPDFYGHQLSQRSRTEFQTYCFTVVLFGASSSPFMLEAVLDLHLSTSPLQVASNMRNNLYVDNIFLLRKRS